MLFFLMRDNIEDDMVAAGITEVFDHPVCIDKEGNACSERDAFAFKVTHNMKHPEHFVIADEAGGNISQKGNRHMRGT